MAKCGTTPVSELYLCDCAELPMDYSNTYLFDDQLEQQKYFQSKVVLKFDKYTYLRKDSSIKINSHFDNVHHINYLFYKNKAGKWYYCFIADKQYINEQVTMLYIATDLIQTYMFDLELRESYVDSMHVPRWNGALPTNEFEPEGLEYGENILFDDLLNPTVVKRLDNNYLAVCSNPLGYIEGRKQWGADGKEEQEDFPHITECGDWKKGIISPDGLRFIKGEEGYSAEAYLDTIAVPNVWTIGYGVTKPSEPDAYKWLDDKHGASEEDCAKVSYYLKNERYGKPIVPKCESMGITEQREFDALVSFVYNLGTGVLQPSSQIWLAIKGYKDGSKGKEDVRNAFLLYNKAGGKPEPGLTRRRGEEAKMFLGEAYTSKDIDIIKNGRPSGQTVQGDGWLPDCKPYAFYRKVGECDCQYK